MCICNCCYVSTYSFHTSSPTSQKIYLRHQYTMNTCNTDLHTIHVAQYTASKVHYMYRVAYSRHRVTTIRLRVELASAASSIPANNIYLVVPFLKLCLAESTGADACINRAIRLLDSGTLCVTWLCRTCCILYIVTALCHCRVNSNRHSVSRNRQLGQLIVSPPRHSTTLCQSSET